MAPSSVAKRYTAGTDRPWAGTRKARVVLKTSPVGTPVATDPEAAPAGIWMTRGWKAGTGAPWALTAVAGPLSLLARTIGPKGAAASPQGLRRFALVCSARLGMSEARLVCMNPAEGTQRSSSSSRVGLADGVVRRAGRCGEGERRCMGSPLAMGQTREGFAKEAAPRNRKVLPDSPFSALGLSCRQLDILSMLGASVKGIPLLEFR